MKKTGNLLLVLSFFICYLEWGKDSKMFLFQAVGTIFQRGAQSISNVAHPFVLVPLAGVVMLIITAFQKTPSWRLTVAGLCCLAILVVFICFIGILTLNWKIILSTLPFLITSVWIIGQRLRQKKLKVVE